MLFEIKYMQERDNVTDKAISFQLEKKNQYIKCVKKRFYCYYLMFYSTSLDLEAISIPFFRGVTVKFKRKG